MENEGGYQGSGTAGGTCGCFAAAGFTWAVMIPFLFGWAWSGAHCAPAPQCRDGIGWLIAGQMTVILALAALFGSSVRAVVN